jgi:phytoene dehydrogenase-like protein
MWTYATSEGQALTEQQEQQVTPEFKAGTRRAHVAVPEAVDVAIIGAGLGGLVAAAQLARRGLRVAVFEQHYVAGGCATQFSRGPKRARYNFDVGLHYIGDCGPEGVIPRILREVGIELEYEPMDPDGFDTLVFPGLRFRIPSDVERYRARLVETFPRESSAIDRYVKLLRATMKATRILDARDGRMSLGAVAAMALDALRVAGIQAKTIGQVLDECGAREPALRAVLLGQSGDYGLPPSEASAVLHLGLAGHYFRGAYYPRGGGQVIADSLALAVERAGGSVHLRRGVEQILVGPDGAARGVRLESRAGEAARDVRARVVLSNADLKATLKHLIAAEHLPSSWQAREKGFKMAGALFLTFLGVSADLRALGMRGVNYWQFDDFDVERMYRPAPGDDPLRPRACYVTSSSLKDPTNAAHHAPAGVTNVEVMTLVPGGTELWGVSPDAAEAWAYRDSGEYREKKARVEEQMIARLDALFPGAARGIVFRESSTPVSHVRFTRASDGTGYGLAATPGQFLRGRPGYRGPFAGLYFCGASTRAGHGVVGAMSSGRQAALRIAADLDKLAVARV